jgi:nucleoside-diphosphate-sugar epimerase
MTVLVTGAAGFVGWHVVRALQQRGSEVVALRREDLDYRDAHAVEEVLRAAAPTSLVHAAWRLAPGSAFLDDPGNCEEREASLRLFELARSAGCRRVVGLGTCLEYEFSDGPVAEDAPLRPLNTYASSKAELFAKGQAALGDSFTWARIYYPFGPREPSHRFVPSVVNSLLRGERIATTAGTQLRSFLHVEDAGNAIASLALADAAGAFNVGSPDAVPIRDAVERIAEAVGRPDLLDIGARPQRPGDPEVLWPDTTRLQTEVGWRQKWTLDEGIADAVAWWRIPRA